MHPSSGSEQVCHLFSFLIILCCIVVSITYSEMLIDKSYAQWVVKVDVGIIIVLQFDSISMQVGFIIFIIIQSTVVNIFAENEAPVVVLTFQTSQIHMQSLPKFIMYYLRVLLTSEFIEQLMNLFMLNIQVKKFLYSLAR